MKRSARFKMAIAALLLGSVSLGYSADPMPQASLQDVVDAIKGLSPSFAQDQSQIWNNYVQMRADEQFTQAHDKSSYDLINQYLYQPIYPLTNLQNWQTKFSLMFFGLTRNTVDQKVLCLNSSESGTPQQITLPDGTKISECDYDTNAQMPYDQEIAFLNSSEYTTAEWSAATKTASVVLDPLLKNEVLDAQLTSIPLYVMGQLQSLRSPEYKQDGNGQLLPTGNPSLMAGLEAAIKNLFGETWQNNLAKANALDVMRAQTEIMALNTYIQYQTFKMQQDQLALTVALMSELARINSNK